jgi:hypothetical protein
MTRLLKGALLLLMIVSVLSACSANKKEEQKATNDAVSQAFNSTPKKANNENKDITFHLPFGFEIKEKKQNNILLKNGAKTYILFYNQQEAPASKVVYDATVSTKKDLSFNETYKKDKRFGYLLIEEIEKNSNEVTVGIGGVKMTSVTKTSNMKTEAKAMMDIVNSVNMIKKSGKE